MERRIKQDGFQGIAIDPMHARIAADDVAYQPIYQKCCELDIPVIITSGPSRLIAGVVMEHTAPAILTE